jgi:hypothetical protein
VRRDDEGSQPRHELWARTPSVRHEAELLETEVELFAITARLLLTQFCLV